MKIGVRNKIHVKEVPALSPQARISFVRLVSRKIQLKGCRSGMNDAENGLGGGNGSTMAE